MKFELSLTIVAVLGLLIPQFARGVSPAPAEMALSRQWAAEKFEGGKQAKDGEPFFSFAYDGKPSAELLKTWDLKRVSRQLDGKRILKPETVDLMSSNHLADELVPITLGPLPLANTGFGLDFAVRVKVAPGEPEGSMGEYWWGGAASTQFFIAPREPAAAR